MMKESLVLALFLIAWLGTVSLTACRSEKAPQNETLTLLIGTYTGSGSEGIYQVTFDPDSGSLSSLGLLVPTDNPSFLCQSPDQQRVYAVNERKPGEVVVFEWTPEGTALEPVGQSSSGGDHPCFIEAHEAYLVFANYSSGNVGFYPLDKEGEISGELQLRQHQGNGPVMPNQGSAHAHCMKSGPSGAFLFAADLGIDQILAYPVREDGLGEQQLALALAPGDGPRHLAFDQEKGLMFVVNELSGTVVSATIDEESGSCSIVDRQSTLPEDFDGANACADIHLSPDGRFLYASNRGHNSIAIFSVSEEGKLLLLGTESVRGDWPRNFTLSPDGAFLLVANQHSDNITVFNRDPATGMLDFTGQELSISKPVCLVFK